MKPYTLTALLVTVIAWSSLGGTALAAPAKKDRTKYDCREVVGYRTEYVGRSNIPIRRAILACPHKDLMAAGKCESHWLFGMRCKE